MKQSIRHKQDACDIKIINRNAERLNAEAADVLEYQAHLDQLDDWSIASETRRD